MENNDFEFTPEEVALFLRRFEEGYDMYDERCEKWKQQNQLEDDPKHSASNDQLEDLQHSCLEGSEVTELQEKSVSLKPQSKLMKRLVREPPSVPKPYIPDMTKTSSARVLTSRESLRLKRRRRKRRNFLKRNVEERKGKLNEH